MLIYMKTLIEPISSNNTGNIFFIFYALLYLNREHHDICVQKSWIRFQNEVYNVSSVTKYTALKEAHPGDVTSRYGLPENCLRSIT